MGTPSLVPRPKEVEEEKGPGFSCFANALNRGANSVVEAETASFAGHPLEGLAWIAKVYEVTES